VRSVPLARLLLDAGADPNGRGEGGFTALHSAAQNGDDELVALLQERGADPGLATDDGRTPADLAS
jgi:ankyrin repeat protein